MQRLVLLLLFICCVKAAIVDTIYAQRNAPFRNFTAPWPAKDIRQGYTYDGGEIWVSFRSYTVAANGDLISGAIDPNRKFNVAQFQVVNNVNTFVPVQCTDLTQSYTADTHGVYNFKFTVSSSYIGCCDFIPKFEDGSLAIYGGDINNGGQGGYRMCVVA